jgi:hypothetical protein
LRSRDDRRIGKYSGEIGREENCQGAAMAVLSSSPSSAQAAIGAGGTSRSQPLDALTTKTESWLLRGSNPAFWEEYAMKAFALAMAVIAAATAACASPKTFRIGSFAVDTDKDPISDQTNYFAITPGQDGSALAVRCIRGEQNFLVVVPAVAKQGDEVEVEARFDSGAVTGFAGEVLKSEDGTIGIEFGDQDAIGKMSGARRAAVRVTLAEVVLTYTFSLRDSAKVVAGVQAACQAAAGNAGQSN